MTERTSIFSGVDDFELPDLAGAEKAAPSPVDKEATLKAAAKAGFTDREPPKPSPAQIKPEPAPPADARRRFRTGRNIQINVKVTAEARDAFFEVVDRMSEGEGRAISQGEALERAVKALADQLDRAE